ncbi:NAD(P)-dependent oxidoreductase [Nocardia asteroides]|uniref:NAD(P)-dependent oxidoreductase n=1 Tax=Nocardia asteroides TaxID=1824 RepID=UPI001E42DD18|nr:NAD(P)-binding domain-containing protein [Nocardia asteroides]UGT60093.1 NAD(P)-binding domain-containing protein [Nocardia asteroides]
MTSTPVTVLGLGRMGSAIAAVLLRAGHPVTVWNRTPGRGAELTGATVATSLASAVAASPLIVSVSASTAAAAETLLPLGPGLRGRTVLNVATGRPDQARELAAELEQHGARFLDGAMLAVPQTLGTPESLLLHSGSESASAEHADVLAAWGTTRYLGTDPGAAALHDMAVLGGMYGLFAGFFQATAMVGGSARGFTDDLLVPWLRALLDLLPLLADEIDSGEYPVSFSDLAVNRSGLADIQATAADAGVRTDLIDPLLRIFEAQEKAGHGAASFTRAVAALRPALSAAR